MILAVQAEAPSKAGFKRPLRLPGEESVEVMITQEECEPSAGLDVAVETPSELSDADEDFLREQASLLFCCIPLICHQPSLRMHVYMLRRIAQLQHLWRPAC